MKLICLIGATLLVIVVLFSLTKSVQALEAGCEQFDFNGDGTVDVSDTQMVAFHFGFRVGDPNYDPKYDPNGDGVIDQADINLILDCLRSHEGPSFRTPSGKLSDVTDPLKDRFATVGGIISELLPYIFALAGMLALLFLIWGGFKYMMAQGDPKLMDEAKSTITSAIIGLLIVLLVVVIFSLVEAVFKIKIFAQIPPPVYAQGVSIADKFPLAKEFPNLGSFFTRIVRAALAAAAIIFFALIVWGGIRYINAGGNPENVEKARGTLVDAVIGLVIVVTSLVIIEIVTKITSGTGIEVPNIFGQ